MAFRRIVPSIWHNARRAINPSCPQSNATRVKNYYCTRRHLPIWRRRSLLDDFFDHRRPFAWPSKLMGKQFREMEKFMDDIAPNRWWVKEPFYTRSTGKEIEMKYNDKVFEVKLDVSQYSPEDVNVKVTKDTLTISAKYEQKPDEHGYISREFTRQFLIPEDVEAESLESLLTNDGYLVIRGSVKGNDPTTERTIKIEREKATEEKPEKLD